MLKKYLLENVEDLIRLIDEINSYNGALKHLIAYKNDKELIKLYVDEVIEEFQTYRRYYKI